MPKSHWRAGINRRSLVKTGAVLAAAQFASPFVIRARAADAVKIGVDNPLTGAYAAQGKNELVGFQIALDEINAKGGILGRPVELRVEDSSTGDAGTAVQKARKLIDGDKVDFLLGNVNSALSLAMAQVSNEKGVLQIVPGGHTDAITGANCHWNVFRVCNTTQMEAAAVCTALIKQYGKKFYYITPDYAFGHTLESGMVKAAGALGGEKVGGDLTPLGSVDFSSYLIKAQATNPGRHRLSRPGRRHAERHEAGGPVRAPKQSASGRRPAGAGAADGLATRGAHRHMGAGMVLESARRAACRRVCRDDQEAHRRPRADGPHLVRLRFGVDLRARSGKGELTEGSRHGEGLAGLSSAAGSRALGPNPAFYRAGQNQLLASLFVGSAQASGSGPEDLFHVTEVVNGAAVASSVEESGCKMTWPT